MYAESTTEEPGDEIVVTDLRRRACGWGMSICYDLRFPELYRILALRGAELLTVPSAFTLPTTRDHWEMLVRARAIENQCFVIAAQPDRRPPRRPAVRRAVADRRPWGLVLASAPDTETRDRRRPRLRGPARHPPPAAVAAPAAAPRPTRWEQPV